MGIIALILLLNNLHSTSKWQNQWSNQDGRLVFINDTYEIFSTGAINNDMSLPALTTSYVLDKRNNRYYLCLIDSFNLKDNCRSIHKDEVIAELK